jgi:hypothetical protein
MTLPMTVLPFWKRATKIPKHELESTDTDAPSANPPVFDGIAGFGGTVGIRPRKSLTQCSVS